MSATAPEVSASWPSSLRATSWWDDANEANPLIEQIGANVVG